MGLKSRSDSFDSPKTEVGEIDTRAPFASVKAAVSLFGEVAFVPDKTPRKPKSSTPEAKAFATESQLHLAQKELNKFKERLRNAETTRAQVLNELEEAKKTVDELTHKLAIMNESKENALKATEEANNQTNQLKDEVTSPGSQNGKLELDQSREQYASAVAELDSAKQELRKIRKDFESAVDAKMAAFNQEAEAKQKSELNAAKADHISKEIIAVQDTLLHVKLATEQAKQEEFVIQSEKETMRESYQLALEKTERKLSALKNDFDPFAHKELEQKLVEADAEITAVRKELEDVKASDLDAVTTVTTELDGAKEVLQRVAEEESSLRSIVETLRVQLQAVIKEHNNLKERESETDILIGDLNSKIQKCKSELESAMQEEAKARSASSELMSTLQQLSTESETALKDAESMKEQAEALRKEAESSRETLSETEKKLEIALREAEEAKVAEAVALEEIRNLSSVTSAARSSTSESAEITISKEEYESLRQKVEESEKLTEMKVAAAVAQVDAVRSSEAEAEQRLEAARKEIKEMEEATEEALRRAEMAEAAKKAVESELNRWREKERKRAEQILAETEAVETAVVPAAAVRTRKPPAGEEGGKKGWSKLMGAHSSKKTLLPNISGMFQRRKSHVERGSSAPASP